MRLRFFFFFIIGVGLIFVSCQSSQINTIHLGNFEIKVKNDDVVEIKTSDDDVNINLINHSIKIKDLVFEDKDNDGFVDVDTQKKVVGKDYSVILSKNAVVLNTKKNNKETPVYVEINKGNLKIKAINQDSDENFEKIINPIKTEKSYFYVEIDKTDSEKNESIKKKILTKKGESFVKLKEENKNNVVIIDLDSNSQYEIMITLDSNGNVLSYKINNFEIVKVLGKDILTILKTLKERNFKIDESIINKVFDIIKNKFPDKFEVINYIKQNPEIIKKILELDYLELQSKLNNLLKELEKQETVEDTENSENQIKNQTQNDTKQTEEIKSQENNSKTTENESYVNEELIANIDQTFSKCAKTIEDYYNMVKNEQDPESLFDKSIDKEALKKLHNAIYENFDFIDINVLMEKCYYLNDLVVCDYILNSKIKDKQGNIAENKVKYSTFLSKDCKIIQTIKR